MVEGTDFLLESDFSENLFVLNYASRLLTAVSDRELLVDMALETLADFGSSPRVGLFTLDGQGKRMALDKVFAGNEAWQEELAIDVAETPFEGLVADPADKVFALRPGYAAPVPTEKGEGVCLVLPLVATSGLVLGAVTMELESKPEFETLSYLRLLGTVISISLNNARLFELAMVDGLTGLFMRRYYDVLVEEEVARAANGAGPLSLVVFDIDHFKRVNDNWGHATGDEVLRQMAREVKLAAGMSGNSPCRYGGEEFVLLLPGMQAQEAYPLVEKIRSRVGALSFPGIEPPLRITVSAGIATMPQGAGWTAVELFEKADGALYEAKETGRDQALIAKE